MRENRIEWIDGIKGIGILLMVVGHAGNIPNTKLWVYSFHMPLFFIIAGYGYGMFSENKYQGLDGFKALMKRNTLAYIRPYFFYFS